MVSNKFTERRDGDAPLRCEPAERQAVPCWTAVMQLVAEQFAEAPAAARGMRVVLLLDFSPQGFDVRDFDEHSESIQERGLSMTVNEAMILTRDKFVEERDGAPDGPVSARYLEAREQFPVTMAIALETFARQAASQAPPLSGQTR